MIQKINEAIDNGFDFNDDKTDLDTENEIHPIDCKYYTIEEFNEKHFNSAKHFSILHLNIHSFELHIEELRIVLKLINLKFDFICITVSKIRKNSEPKIDITIDDYQIPVGTPTEATKWGAMIYAKEGIDFILREDLIIYKTKELESYFIEVIDTKRKNTIIGTVYRHPCLDQKIFIDDYMQPLMKENIKTFLAGDYNFDFLNTDENETFNFFETMMPSHLLPTILIPTKINPNKNTVIDNIFTNQIHPDMASGNFTVAISDHLPSFFLIPKDKQNLYTRKTKNFDREIFIYDYLDIDWDSIVEANKNNVNTSLQASLTKINQLPDKYMPLRKLTNKEYKRRFKPWISDNMGDSRKFATSHIRDAKIKLIFLLRICTFI